MNRKNKKLLIGIIIVLFSVISLALVYNSGGMKFLSVSGGETITPVFCNDYEFTCCGGKVTNIASVSITDEKPWRCPTTAYKCEIGNIVGPVLSVQPYIGKTSCALSNYRLLGVSIGDRFYCSDELQSSRKVLNPGEYIWTMNSLARTSNVVGTLNDIKIISPQLGFCGRSGSVGEQVTCGVSVSGADGCTFSPTGGKVYTSTSSLSGLVQAVSYTVPLGDCVLAFQSGDRHICGYKEETCSIDSDCGGHTYGNKECNARTLQTYGCKSFGTTIIGKDRSPSDPGWSTSDASQTSANTFGKRCEIISAQQVQCCGDTDCGTNYRCDISTNTCKPATQVQCTNNYDCGVSVQCDFSTNKLKTPICSSGKCSFSEVSVGCCNDNNCPYDSYCSAERKCVLKVASKQQCNKQCCVSEEMYFDRLCPDSTPFCVSGACSITPPVPSKCPSCDAFAKSVILGKFMKSQTCEPQGITLLPPSPGQSILTCIFSILKLFAVPFFFILSLLFSVQIITRIMKGKYPALNWVLAIISALLVGYMTYILFWWGFWIFILYLIIRIGINFIPGYKFIK